MRKQFIVAAAAVAILAATGGVSIAQTLTTAQVTQAQTLATTLANAAKAKGKASAQVLQQAMQDAAAASGQPPAVIAAAFQAVSVAAGANSTLGQAAIGGATAAFQSTGLSATQAQQQASSPPANIVAAATSNTGLTSATTAVASNQSSTSTTGGQTGGQQASNNNPSQVIQTFLSSFNTNTNVASQTQFFGTFVYGGLAFTGLAVNTFGSQLSLSNQISNIGQGVTDFANSISSAIHIGPYSTSS